MLNLSKLNRRLVTGLTTLALTGVGTALATPAAAQSAPPAGSVPMSSTYLDELGRPTPYLQERVREFANQPFVPPQLRDTLLSALAFTAGYGELGGPELPTDAPTFTQFYWPTISGGCIGGQGDAVASALAVPGPATIPAPGAAEGQTSFLFTALGTPPAAENQGGLYVHWLNLDNLRFGATPLANNGINPEGPATVSGTADTGNGTIVAIVGGDLNTTESTCHFLPTAAIIDAR
ncbi:hypothetical protein C3B44_07240 [Corynebacterium yudongzhengii]|uniref:Secreted protein n=1 Tax=Corynebacterium yudongzhengii TaxID=2080740 RepID=A0A2U1T470_9CORY|nr:hypothetical protein [Corynebacterium yudongzhengii]AWB82175.1 hypothetical protein C3B44_07240 [Corynebacterium yudongzhengii]PWC00806.1 hypothetical protein DF222_10845 [Corynebacterium yudongzhengii]